MRLWGWRRRSDAGDEEYPEPLDVSAVWDEQLSAHLDGELDEHEAAVVDEAIEADPTLAVRLNELAAVRDALGSLGEVRAPRPFTLEAPPTAARRTPGRLELVFRMGAVAAAVAFAIVLTGDIAGLGGEGVEGWGISSPGFGSGESEQASAAPQAAPAALRTAATAATATPVATQVASTAPTAQPTAAADTAAAAPTPQPTVAAVATPQPTVAAVAAATAEATVAATALAAPALPTVTRESRVAARSAEPDEATAAPAAEELPEAAARAPEASAEEAPAATPAADESADRSGEAGDASEAATPAAAAEAAPAATATVAPAIPDESVQIEAEDGDDAARALRRAEQGLLVAALALVGLTLLLGLWRRRGGAA